MAERTEELGLSARLPIVVGGQEVTLRTLNLDESDEWQKQFAALELSTDTDGDAATATDKMLGLVEAYDVDGALGAALRKRFTRRELYDAVKQMAASENPFLSEEPSVAKAFGQVLANHLLLTQFQPASSMNGQPPTGASTRRRSAASSRKKDSSSSGPTASGASSAKPRKP